MSTLNMFDDPAKLEKRRSQIISLIGEEWYRYIGELFDRPYMKNLIAFLSERRKIVKVYPSSPNVFRAFKTLPYKDIKVVILGQDPYYNGSADGLAFSTGAPNTPKSLQIIFEEIARTHEGYNVRRMPDLTDWAKQGILLLNTVLTVEQGNAGSHEGKGWEQFTVEVIKRLNHHPMPLVFVLWGAKARQYDKYIDKKYHLILESPHPASEAYGTGKFIGNGHFDMIDEHIMKNYNTKIKW